MSARWVAAATAFALSVSGCGVAASSPTAGSDPAGVRRPPLAPDRIPVRVFNAYIHKAQEAILKAERTHADPAATIGLTPGCRGWLGAEVTDLFCGLTGDSIEVSGAPELRISGRGVGGGGDGAVTQLMGLPLRPGGVLHLTATRRATGALVVESAPAAGAVTFSRFQLDLPAGATAEVRDDAGRGVLLERGNATEAPAGSVTTREPNVPLPPLPNSAGPYQDCRAVGKVESLTDPRGDAALNTGNVSVGSSYRGIDITRAALAHAGNLICLDLELTSSPVVGDDYELFVTAPQGATPGGAKLDFSLLSPTDRVMSTGEFWALEPRGGYVTVPRGLIGLRGDELSLMIDQRQLGLPRSFERFVWQVTALTSASPGVEPYDCAPNYGDALYPPGYRVTKPLPGVGPVRPTRCML